MSNATPAQRNCAQDPDYLARLGQQMQHRDPAPADPRLAMNAYNPPASPAQLLAAVLRVVAPQHRVEVLDSDVALVHYSELDSPRVFSATSLSDLARVVAMLDGTQRFRFNEAMLHTALRVGPGITSSEVLCSETSTILAALVAAVGLGEGRA